MGNSPESNYANLAGDGGQVPEAQEIEREESTPTLEDEDSIAYLGVRLKKAKVPSSFVPDREKYADYHNDRFALRLQQKIAISLLQGDPLLIEGGTSIGKTTTVRKMCAELGWEVHYANLNGATDVEDLMGRYIPNPNKTKPEDPEYIFADGKVTSGLRQEEGKTKVIILDEFNASAPNILIRLHEVLDALERGEDVVLSEDASGAVKVNKENTKVIALMNPPGRGYFGREPLDPAQLRRWVYQKEVSELPEETFVFATQSLFGIGTESETISEDEFLEPQDQCLSREQLAEIPGIKEILEKYKEFHKAAKELVKQRTVAADQPQPFTFDDRVEPYRVNRFVARFFNGDINETFQRALRYYYVNKLENPEDRQKLEELINHVAYIAPVESRRRTIEPETKTGVTAKAKKEKTEVEAIKERGRDPEQFLNEFFDWVETDTSWSRRNDWNWIIFEREGVINMRIKTKVSEHSIPPHLIDRHLVSMDISEVSSHDDGVGVDSLLASLKGKLIETIEDDNYQYYLRIIDTKKTETAPDEPASEEEVSFERTKLEGDIDEQIELAGEILGHENVFGPQEVLETFGVELDDIPAIPFSREELEREKEMGQMLILRVDRTDNDEPLSMAKMNEILMEKWVDTNLLDTPSGWDRLIGASAYHDETPRAGWALVSKEILPESNGKEYIDKIELVIKTLKEKVFKNMELPKEYADAIEEFESKKESLSEKATFREITDLKIVKLTLPTIQEVIYDLAMYYDRNSTRLFSGPNIVSSTYVEDGSKIISASNSASGIIGIGGLLNEASSGVCISRRM